MSLIFVLVVFVVLLVGIRLLELLAILSHRTLSGPVDPEAFLGVVIPNTQCKPTFEANREDSRLAGTKAKESMRNTNE